MGLLYLFVMGRRDDESGKILFYSYIFSHTGFLLLGAMLVFWATHPPKVWHQVAGPVTFLIYTVVLIVVSIKFFFKHHNLKFKHR